MISALRFTLCFAIAMAIALVQAATLSGTVLETQDKHYVSHTVFLAIVPSIGTSALLYFSSSSWRGRLWAFALGFTGFALLAMLAYRPKFEIERLVKASGEVGDRAEIVRASIESMSVLGLTCGAVALFFGLGALFAFIRMRRDRNHNAVA